MLRPASRLFSRPGTLRSLPHTLPARRFLSTAPPSQKSRSWKNYGIRLALAGYGIYYYNTNDLFAEEPGFVPRSADYESEPENLPTIEALAEQRRQKREAAQQAKSAAEEPVAATERGEAPQPGSVEQLEEEAGQQGAFNPETGEINWDCPCLGGMADGPCGEEFKAAFSCFVFSEAEPKGMDCIDKFQGMQTCFRKYPDVYGAELEDDDEASASASADTSEEQVDLSSTVPDTRPPTSAENPEIRTDSTRPVITAGEKVADRKSIYPSSDDSEVERKRTVAKDAKQQIKESVEANSES